MLHTYFKPLVNIVRMKEESLLAASSGGSGGGGGGGGAKRFIFDTGDNETFDGSFNEQSGE